MARRHALTPLLLALLIACGGPSTTAKPAEKPMPPELAAKLDDFAARLEAKRKELAIPGLSLVIVKDDQVIYLAGHGLADITHQAPVTEDTLFAIGSTTKAFTAMLALMAEEAGVLSLDQPPRKCLPYFKLADPGDDAKIVVRDLFTHTSGLMRTDLGWITGKLSKREVIELAGKAERVAPLGQEWNYQNVMYLAAGECVATAMGQSYEQLLHQRIFAPLGMKDANVSVTRTLGLPTRAIGYAQLGKDKALAPVPMRPLDSIAPAGAINASARDMGQWLRLLLSRGAIDGKRVVSEESFAKLSKAYIEVSPGTGYGLGWGLSEWSGHRQMSHTGGIDGFVTLVALLPDEHLGFALFSNIESGDIHGYVTNEVFSLFFPEQHAATPPSAGDPRVEVGTYGVLGGIKMELKMEAGGLLRLHVPGQPAYPLEPVGGRRYRLGAPAPAGFFANFRPSETHPGETELFLEQPHGDMVLRKLTPEIIAAAKDVPPPPELAELLGTYRVKDKPVEFSVVLIEGQVAVQIPAQPALPLEVGPSKDEFAFAGVPSMSIVVHRDPRGAITSATFEQPGQNVELERVQGGDGPPLPSVQELAARVAAANHSARLEQLRSVVVHRDLDLVNQGLGAREVSYATADNRGATDVTLVAFDREIGRTRTAFDGKTAIEVVDFIPTADPVGSAADAIAVAAIFNPHDHWDQLFTDVTVTRTSRVEDEEVYVVTKTRASGVTLTDYYSQRSFLLLERQTVVPGTADGPASATVEVFSDYREVHGLMIPHRMETRNPLAGKVVATVTRVEVDVPVPESVFTRPAW